ncbi:hypothetical protein Sarmat_00237 [Rickettsiales endosymbiont of Paramecium tredecaurelia]|nr:hypothetical protein [Candidatus Sarmatiella mevalonica]
MLLACILFLHLYLCLELRGGRLKLARNAFVTTFITKINYEVKRYFKKNLKKYKINIKYSGN